MSHPGPGKRGDSRRPFVTARRLSCVGIYNYDLILWDLRATHDRSFKHNPRNKNKFFLTYSRMNFLMYVQHFKYCAAILDQLMGEQGLNALDHKKDRPRLCLSGQLT